MSLSYLDGTNVLTELIEIGGNRHRCKYKPQRPGLHIISANIKGVRPWWSPLLVDILPRLQYPESKLEATVVGLDSNDECVRGRPIRVKVAFNGVGHLVTIKEEVDDDIKQNSFNKSLFEDAIEYTFIPNWIKGVKLLKVFANNEHINHSPFIFSLNNQLSKT